VTATLPFTPDLWPDDYPPEPDFDEPEPAPVDDFWDARPVLRHIHDFARARRVAPWAVFGATLARVVAATEPNAQLPPTIGSYASLNLFVGMVGPPGAGKDAARKVANEALDLGKHEAFLTAPLGSGEGLSHMFMRESKEGAEQYNVAALVTIGEIDTLTALVKRQSSTVSSQLRQAAMGEQLGFFYVDTAKRMMVPEHRYRMCLLAGIQPKRAGGLLDDADGGTPQRFVWLPATDPQAPDDAPECPTPMLWEPPRWHETGRGSTVAGMYRNPVAICSEAEQTIVRAHLARTRGHGDALDGHALLTRLKVAAALAILEGRCEVRDADWNLSGAVMAVSDRTREMCVKVLAEESLRNNKQQAVAEAARTIVVQERVNEAAVQRVARTLRRALAKAGIEGRSGGELRRAVAGPDRQYFDAALTSLVMAAVASEEKSETRGQVGMRYRFVGDES
jgi:hypothetical protein